MTKCLENIDVQVESIKRELRKLDSRITAKEKPWYREGATVVAALALLFSFGTTVISYVKSSQQEVLSSRIELSELIKNISNIPQEHAEMISVFKNEPLTVAQLSSQINSKNLSLGSRAKAVIERIENSWYGNGTVLDVEYMAVAASLLSSFQFDKAKSLFEEAYKRARDATTAAGALRSTASIYMGYGDTSSMRQYLYKASKIYKNSKYTSDPDTSKYVTNSTTELQWAYGEFQLGECENALVHLNYALPILNLIPSSPIKEQLLSQANQTQATINHACNSTGSDIQSSG